MNDTQVWKRKLSTITSGNSKGPPDGNNPSILFTGKVLRNVVMNGAEWLEVYTNASSNGLTALAILLTMVSGYIAIAYLVGKKLTTLQVVLINIVYISSGTSVLLSNYGSVLDSATARREAAHLIREVREVMGIEGTPEVLALVVAGTNSLYLVISLVFMWQVRHSKAEGL